MKRETIRRWRAIPLAFLLALGLIIPSLSTGPSVLADPETFVVNTTADSNNGCAPAPGDCSLREAILASNANNNPNDLDRITFAIPGQGVQTIRPESSLPQIRSRVVIDGYTQPGSRPNTVASGTNAQLMIELDGSQAGGGNGLVNGPGGQTIIRGLIINNFAVAGARDEGVSLTLEGNFIGTDATGTARRPNRVAGVLIATPAGSTTIGNGTPAGRNLISGNGGDGIAAVTGNVLDVVDNLIGTDRTGTRQVFNERSGILLGINGSEIIGNTIALNGQEGIAVVRLGDGVNPVSNQISRNTFFGNDNMDIDLGDDGRTANDAGDGDSGPNNLQNFPLLETAAGAQGRTTITGSLNSLPSQSFQIEFYESPFNPGDGRGGRFLGATQVTTDGNGDTLFAFTADRNVAGGFITATATRISGQNPGDTSEFSSAIQVTGTPDQNDDKDQGQEEKKEKKKKDKKKNKKDKKGKKGKKGKNKGKGKGKGKKGRGKGGKHRRGR